MKLTIDWPRMAGAILMLVALFVTTWWGAQVQAEASYLKGLTLWEAVKLDGWILPSWMLTMMAWDLWKCWSQTRALRRGALPTQPQPDPATLSAYRHDRETSASARRQGSLSLSGKRYPARQGLAAGA